MTTSNNGRRHVRPVCAICHKRIRHDKPQGATRAGDPAHVSCLDAATPVGQSAGRTPGAGTRRPPPEQRSAAAVVGDCRICGRPLVGARHVQDRGGAVHWNCMPVDRVGTPPRSDRGATGRPSAAAAPDSDAPVPAIAATRSGRCPMCEKPYPVRTRLIKTPLGWVHVACSPQPLAEAEFERNRGAILAGETYRAQGSSGWRRRGAPSKRG